MHYLKLVYEEIFSANFGKNYCETQEFSLNEKNHFLKKIVGLKLTMTLINNHGQPATHYT